MYWASLSKEDKREPIFDRAGDNSLFECLKRRSFRKLKNKNLRSRKKRNYRRKRKTAMDVDMELDPLNVELFVTADKSALLMMDVLNDLTSKFNVAVETGPGDSDDTCKLLLTPLQPCSYDTMLEAKELLQCYLTMIKESTSRVEEKPPEIEIVEIEDDEENSCAVISDSSIVVIDVDECETSQTNSNSNVVRTDSCDEVVILDVTTEDSTSSPQGCVPGDTINNSHRRALKRKQNLEAVESVELDDDIIVLDDSFVAPSCNSKPSVICTVNNSSSSMNISGLKVSVQGEERNVYNESLRSVNEVNNGSVKKSNTYKITLTVSDKHTPKLNESSGQPKKLSNLSYKRPAHLTCTLTKSISGEGSSKNDSSSSNIYNPNEALEEKRTGLRPIVIDGNNVAVGHGKGTFSLKGIQICINYFEMRGHRTIKAFIPHYRINRDTFDDLHAMERQGTVVLTPSRKVDGQTVASYDDRYIVQYAAEFGGVIVSTDNYRDLIAENPSWKETIEQRLLMFTWVDDLLMFPQDPLGRTGPSLDAFLSFSE